MATVLLVEDESLLAGCLERWLHADAHTVVIASDAQGAIDALDMVRPDVIVLDILLPGANGIQVLHTLCSHADLASIPVIICSSVVTKYTPNLAAYGVKKVIDKTTLSRKNLCAVVGEVLI